jgi:hypothetical protein
MNRSRLPLFMTVGLFLALVSTVSWVLFSAHAQETVTQKLFADDLALRDLANYKQWTRANEVPLPVTFSLVNVASFAITGS